MENKEKEVKTVQGKTGKKATKLTDERLAFKPFNYPWAYDAWLKHEQSHWLFSEVPMIEDVKDWKRKLSNEEKQFLTHIFRFFTQGDIDVAGGYVRNYLPYFPQPEVRMMLSGFAAREALHIAAYSHLIETLGLPETTYNQFLEYQEMKDKHDYVLDISSKNGDIASTATHIAVFSAFTEGMQLFSSFIMLLNFPRHGKMKGMGQIITWSIVDETMHAESMIKLFRTYVEENREIWNDDLKSKIYTIATRMVELEDKFIDLAFSMGDMPDLSADDVKHYIRYIADRRLISLGLKGIMKVKKNPLPWVEEMINAPTHTNFFENKATDYAKGALSGSWDDVWGKAA
jgi:ribonucleoside-diphosphate reductase beta chain